MNLLSTDSESLHAALHRAQLEWKRVSSQLSEHFDVWERNADQILAGIVTFHKADTTGEPAKGSVLGKEFTIHISPRQLDNRLYAQAVVASASPTAIAPKEICRFLIDRNGSFLNLKAEVLLSDEHTSPSFTMLSNIAYSVLGAEL